MVSPAQWIIPFDIINLLTRMPMQPSMNEDLDKLPHVIITSDDIWNPTVLEHSIDMEQYGHLTQPAIESVYSGVVSICSIHLILVIAKFNDLPPCQADVRKAYLEAYTKKDLFHCWKRIHHFWDARSHSHYI